MSPCGASVGFTVLLLGHAVRAYSLYGDRRRVVGVERPLRWRAGNAPAVAAARRGAAWAGLGA
jgi:hypothetical protein